MRAIAEFFYLSIEGSNFLYVCSSVTLIASVHERSELSGLQIHFRREINWTTHNHLE